MYNIQLNRDELDMLNYILKSVDLNLALGCFDFKRFEGYTCKDDFKSLLHKVRYSVIYNKGEVK